MRHPQLSGVMCTRTGVTDPGSGPKRVQHQSLYLLVHSGRPQKIQQNHRCLNHARAATLGEEAQAPILVQGASREVPSTNDNCTVPSCRGSPTDRLSRLTLPVGRLPSCLEILQRSKALGAGQLPSVTQVALIQSGEGLTEKGRPPPTPQEGDA